MIFNVVYEPEHSKKMLEEFENKYNMTTKNFAKKYENKEEMSINHYKQAEWYHYYIILKESVNNEKD